MFCQLSKCCCCINLRTGIIIYAVFYMLYALFNIAMEAVFVMDGSDVTNTTIINGTLTNTTVENHDHFFRGTSIVGEIFSIILCLILLFGVIKDMAGFLLIWIVAEIIFIIVDAVSNIGLAIMDDPVLYGVCGAVEFTVGVYFVMVVCSQYRILRG